MSVDGRREDRVVGNKRLQSFKRRLRIVAVEGQHDQRVDGDEAMIEVRSLQRRDEPAEVGRLKPPKRGAV